MLKRIFSYGKDPNSNKQIVILYSTNKLPRDLAIEIWGSSYGGGLTLICSKDLYIIHYAA